MGVVVQLKSKRGIAEIRKEYFYYLDQAKDNGWENKLHCVREPETFIEYAVTPTQEEAQLLCYRCPLLDLCNEYALATKPQTGVLGGIAWRNGRQAQTSEGIPVDEDARFTRQIAA